MTSPIPLSVEIGSPDWWLAYLVDQLIARQPRYDKQEQYVSGNHPLPDGDKRYIKALLSFQKKARTNYIGLVTSAPVERMRVRGFRFGELDADPDAAEIWAASDMDFQQTQIHWAAAVHGVSYALVSPVDETTGYPVITAEDPRQCIVEPDPLRPTKSLAGLKMWVDQLDACVYAVLYLPEAIFVFQGPPVQRISGVDYTKIREALLAPSHQGGFVLIEEHPNEVGIVPLFAYQWQPMFGPNGPGEAENVWDIQDRINHTILDRLVISRSQAYKQRWVAGLKIPKARAGQKKPPFDPGSDVLWATEEPEAKFGEFTSADIRQILEAVRDDIADMAAITKTPAHYLMGKMANVSGDTLTQAETGLSSKTKQRASSIGWTHERVMKCCFLYLGQTDKANSVDASTIWADPEVRSRAETVDAAQKETQMGIPLQLVMEKLGYETKAIEFAIEERDRMEQQKLDQQMMVLDKQAQFKQQSFGQGSTANSNSGSKPANNPNSGSNNGKPRPSKNGQTPGGK